MSPQKVNFTINHLNTLPFLFRLVTSLQDLGAIFIDQLMRIKDMFLQSYRLALGLPPDGSAPKSLPLDLTLRANIPFIPLERLEFITVLARKKSL